MNQKKESFTVWQLLVDWVSSPGISLKRWWIASLTIQWTKQLISQEAAVKMKFHDYGLSSF